MTFCVCQVNLCKNGYTNFRNSGKKKEIRPNCGASPLCAGGVPNPAHAKRARCISTLPFYL